MRMASYRLFGRLNFKHKEELLSFEIAHMDADHKKEPYISHVSLLLLFGPYISKIILLPDYYIIWMVAFYVVILMTNE